MRKNKRGWNMRMDRDRNVYTLLVLYRNQDVKDVKNIDFD